jgi:hypothetical protein
MAKQPSKKKNLDDFKSMSFNDKLDLLNKFKEDNGLKEVQKKEQQWLIINKAFEDATDVVGIPLNTVSCVKGHTNTGKSTFVFEVIKACQRQGILPVIFDLENSFKWDHARDIGVEVSEVVDEETGEILLGPSEKMLYYDTVVLYDLYGLYDHSANKYLTKPNRDIYVIEDVALCIRELIRKQKNDELPFDMMFIIDSIGVGDCYKAAISNGSNNMWFAGALSSAFNVIGNDLIPSTQNINSKYNNSMFYVNKVWTAMTAMNLPSAKEKGGTSFTYFTRFSIFLGGQGTNAIKRQTLTYNGIDYTYGNKVKIKIDKNHITNIEHEGEICSTKNGLCSMKELDNYKNEYKKFLKQELQKKTDKKIEDSDFQENEIECND